jgi:hypothetical protein
MATEVVLLEKLGGNEDKATPKEFNMNNHPMKRSDWGRKKGKL